MKSKLYILILCLVLTFAVCSCNKSSDSSSNLNASSESTSQPDKVKNKAITLKMLTSFSGERFLRNTEDGYYGFSELVHEDGSFNLVYTDFETKTQVYLCNRPECTHNDITCTSFMPFTGSSCGMFVSNQKLVLMNSGNQLFSQLTGDLSLPNVETMNLNGTDRKTIVNLSANQHILQPYATDGGDLIYCIIETTAASDNGTDAIRTLTEINSSNGAVRNIYEFAPNGNEYLLGALGSDFVIKEMKIPAEITPSSSNRPNETLDETIKKHSSIEHTLYTLSLSGELSEPVKRWKQSDLSFMCNSDVFYYVSSSTKAMHQLNLTTMSDDILIENIIETDSTEISFADCWDDYLLFKKTDPKSQNATWYSLYLPTKQVDEFKLTNKFNGDVRNPCIIKAVFEDMYYVEYGTHQGSEVTNDAQGNQKQLSVTYSDCAIISKSDYWSNKPNYIKISRP